MTLCLPSDHMTHTLRPLDVRLTQAPTHNWGITACDARARGGGDICDRVSTALSVLLIHVEEPEMPALHVASGYQQKQGKYEL